MRIECPNCHTSYPAQLLDKNLETRPGVGYDTLCSVCHHHFSYTVTKSRIPFLTRPTVKTKLIGHAK